MDLKKLHRALYKIFLHLDLQKEENELPQLHIPLNQNGIHSITFEDAIVKDFLDYVVKAHNPTQLIFVIHRAEKWFGVVVNKGDMFQPVFRMTVNVPLEITGGNIDLLSVLNQLPQGLNSKVMLNNGKIVYFDNTLTGANSQLNPIAYSERFKTDIAPYLQYLLEVNDIVSLTVKTDGENLLVQFNE